MSNDPVLDARGLEAAADSLTPLGRAARWPQEYVEEQAAFVVAAYLRAAQVASGLEKGRDDA